MRQKRSASFIVLVFSTMVIHSVLAQSPRNVYEWTPEKVVSRAWLAERDEFASNVYIHSPERGFVQAGGGSYCLPVTDLVIPIESTELRIERLYNSNSSFRGVFGIGWHSSLDALLQVNKNKIVEVKIGGVPHRFQSDSANRASLKPLQISTARLKHEENGQYSFLSTDGRRTFSADGTLIAWQKEGTIFEFIYNGRNLTQIRTGSQSLLYVKSTTGGLIEQLTDDTDRTLQFQYDQTGHLTQAKHVDRAIEAYQFNSRGRLTEARFSNGSRINFAWDSKGQIIELKGPGLKRSSFAYNVSSLGREMVVTLPGEPDVSPNSPAHEPNPVGNTPDQVKTKLKLTSAKAKTIFYNANEDGVLPQPTQPTQFTLKTPIRLTYVMNYHWTENNVGTPGKISLKHSDGTMYGPWQAHASKEGDRVNNAMWESEPDVLLKKGTYTVFDSQPETWAQNKGTGGRGITEIRGIKLKSTRLVPALDPTGKWYQHGENDYRFMLPPGWHVEENSRNKVKDEIFDTVVNRDRSLVLICWKGHEAVTDAQAALQQFVREKEQEVKQNPQIAPTVGSRFYQLVNVPAARVGYYLPGRTSAVFRISFVHNNRRYVINVVKTGSARLDEPSPELASLFNSFEFDLQQPVRPTPPKPPLLTPQASTAPAMRRQPAPAQPSEPTQQPALDLASLSWKFNDKNHSVEQIDFEQNVTKKYYDPAGRLIRYVRPDQSQMTFAYDEQGRLIRKTRFDQTLENYTYDGSSERLASVSGSLGKVSISYNEHRLIQEFVDARGITSLYEYDAKKQLRGIKRSNGESADFTYDAQGALQQMTFDGKDAIQLNSSENGRKQTMSASDGATESFQYSSQGQLLRSVDPLGQTTSYEYSPGGKLASTVNPLGETTRYGHDSSGNVRVISLPGERGKVLISYTKSGFPMSVNQPGGQKYQYEFDPFGHMTKTIDPLGRNFEYEYNQLQQLAKMTFPDGTTQDFSYDSAGRLTSEKRGAAPATNYRYDARDRLTEVSSSNGAVRYEYGDHDRPVRLVDLWSGQRVVLQYDTQGRLIQMDDSFRGRTHFEHDETGRLISVRNSLGQLVEFSYTTSDLPVERRQAGGETVRYAYDILGRLNRQNSTVTGTKSFAYDALNRLTEETSSATGQRRFEYDTAGNLTRVQAEQAEFHYEYDSSDNLTVINSAGGGRTSFEYDGVGRLLTRTNALGQRRQFHWNVSDQLESLVREDGKQLSYQYDERRNLVQISQGKTAIRTSEFNAQGLPVKRTINQRRFQYLYDRSGKLLEKRDESLGTSVGYTYGNAERVSTVLLPDGKSLNYRYDPDSRLTGVAGPAGAEIQIEYNKQGRRKSLLAGNTARIEYTYYPNGLIHQINCKKSDGLSVYQAEYGYDQAGRITRAVLQNKKFKYAYDSQGHLIETIYPDGRSEKYEYDLAGNLQKRDTEERKHNILNQLLSSAETTLKYSPTGNLISQSRSDGTTRYEFGPIDLLQRVELKNSTSVEYDYDPEGLLLARTTQGETTQFIQDRKNIVGEMTNGKLNRIYLNGDDLDERFGQIIGKEHYYFITAPDHSVLAVINRSGDVVNSYTYSPHGVVNVLEESIPNRFYAKGRFYDQNSGLYNYRSRWYNAALSIFISADTKAGMLDDPVSQNAYLYLNDDPVNQIDPEGTTGIPALGSTGAIWLEGLKANPIISTPPPVSFPKLPTNQWIPSGMRHPFAQMEAARNATWAAPAPSGPSLTPQQQMSLQSLKSSGLPNRMGTLRRLGGRALPWLGRGLMIYAVGRSVKNVYDAKDRVDQTKREVSAWGSIWLGAKAGGAIGAGVAGVGAVPGSIIGAITGYLGSKLITDPDILLDDTPRMTGENLIYLVPLQFEKGQDQKKLFVEFLVTGEGERMAAKVTLHLPIAAKDAAAFKKEFGIDRKLIFFAERATHGNYVIDDDRLKQAIAKFYKAVASVGVAVGMGFAEGFGGIVIPGGQGAKDKQSKVDATIAGIRVNVHEAEIWLKPDNKKVTGTFKLDVSLSIPEQKTSRKNIEFDFQGKRIPPK